MINIVMGCHRSGTSAIGGLLHTNGIVMGEKPFFLPRPSDENPKGYFEDNRFRLINDRVLAQNGYTVKDWDIPTDAPYKRADTKTWADATALVRSMDDQYPMWGWRDPRTCLTWPFWYEILDNLGRLNAVKIIATWRDCDQIARSMISRGMMPGGMAASGNVGAEKYQRALVEDYYRCVRLARPDVDIFFTDSPRVIAQSLSGIGLHITDTSFLDPTLRERTP